MKRGWYFIGAGFRRAGRRSQKSEVGNQKKAHGSIISNNALLFFLVYSGPSRRLSMPIIYTSNGRFDHDT